jgi:hypothetical protein
LFAVKISNKLLSVEFYSKIDTSLFCYKKEFVEARKKAIQMRKRPMPSTAPILVATAISGQRG